MENFRSKSCRVGKMEIQSNYEGGETAKNVQDMRCYSANYAYSSHHNHLDREIKIKKSKSSNFRSFSSRIWGLSEAELQRKKRVVGYKVYAVEGKMKGSLRKSFKWIKQTCSNVIHGWR